jgi:hypothetical protein
VRLTFTVFFSQLRRANFNAYSIDPCIERRIALENFQAIEQRNEYLLHDIINIKRPSQRFVRQIKHLSFVQIEKLVLGHSIIFIAFP